MKPLSIHPEKRGPAGIRKSPSSPGFALVVVLSMMVLLTLLSVGLLSLSAIALRSAGRSEAREMARSNARMALMLAIGDLQKSAGPDQRVTAMADLAGAADGSAIGAAQKPENAAALDGSDKGLSQVLPGTRYWTGVFRNRDEPSRVYDKTPAARLESWLVSGPQDSANPGQGVTPSLESCAVAADGSVADPSVAAVLVGPNSVGSGGDSQDRYVAVPIVEVDSDSGGGMKGAYAYWVGDEGVKARINMDRRNEDPESYASLVAQRRGWETVDGFGDYLAATGDADRELTRIVSLPSAELLLPSIGGGNPSPMQSAFHSATTDSRGLIVDTLEGGTRVDLSVALGGDLPSSPPVNGYDNYPVSGGRVIPVAAARGLRHLNWDHLYDFYNLRSKLDQGVLKVEERDSSISASVAPIITDFRILMGVRLEASVSGNRPNGKYKVYPCGKFAVAIANPYSVPLEWDEDLDFEIKNITPPGNRPSRIWQLNSTCVFIDGDGTIDRPGRESAVFNQAIFRVKAGRLEPGEARAYTQASKVERGAGNANRTQIVEMESFGSASPFDFNNCVEMKTTSEISLPFTMDVRESWQTTLVTLEMRSGGGSGRGYNWLRRLERFELDNGYFSPNQRTFESSTASRMTGPVPLMLYSFQISQPGMDYKSLMPSGYELGQRSSTLRTFADFNLRASTVHKPIASYNPPPYFMESNDSAALLPFRPPGGDTGTGFTRNLALSPLYWGRSSETGSNSTVLFAVPRQFSSLSQLQHADLTNDDSSISVSHQPGNAFGNSYATPFVKRESIEAPRVDYELVGSPNHSGANQTKNNYYDISHLLNSSLWDRYFFSSLPYGGSKPENSTMIVGPDAGLINFGAPSEVAAGLMIDGAFNINSTDKDAWKAFLASSKYFEHKADSGVLPAAAFPRSLEQPAAHKSPPSGDENDSYSGYRRLSDTELDDLSAEIVRQVRRRGPFVSLSHFVNRALAVIGDEPELTRSGALQFALDESGINISYDGRRNGFDRINSGRDQVTLAAKQGAPRADLDGNDTDGRPSDANSRSPDWARTSRDNNYGAVASIIADREMLLDRKFKPEQGYRSTGIPGWVTQADLLQVIGPSISARSDTFRIRTLGEARDAAGKVIASAYCEAIVQRQPAYVDQANQAFERPAALTNTNKTFGRKFEIVSFRWLSPYEI